MTVPPAETDERRPLGRSGARAACTSPVPSVPDLPGVAEVLSRSGERDHWQQWGLSWAAGEYRRGHADGYVLGDATGYARSDREWLAALAPARALIRDSARRPAHADAERHRWMLRGEQRTRETFGQPHPGDFPGRGGA